MKLTKYRVTDFRSVQDSGWIECDDVTTLVGVNESGKSNLLLALWKLNPAREGTIDILHDMPVSKLSALRTKTSQTPFVSAEFAIDEDSAATISQKLNCKCNEGDIVIVTRFYDGKYSVSFPNGKPAYNEDENDDENVEPESDGFVKKYTSEELKNAVIEELPKFVYYSNYGNLSSKIYLPHVVRWLNGETITGVEINEDQVRTLRVLFDFVNLKPEEILELGKDPKVLAIEHTGNRNQTPSAEEIKKAEDDKEQRSILLQSASGELTRKFKEWWQQGEYKFRFEADGDYFRIWVSDKLRPDEVGLELRSTGLQWFLSFYLIFLVESQEQHKDAILLLDEAGLTLHPLAQKDLCRFFDSLSEENQIINTTHSPFIVDTNNIDRCRVVYSDETGFTVASSNLRDGIGKFGDQSIYAVHAALGLSVSDVLFQGCQTVIVEGPSDQHYLNAIKNYLVSEKLITYKQDIVFVPSGGVRGVPGVVSLLTGKKGTLPYVILDSDKSGSDSKKKLESNLYKECRNSLIEIKDFVGFDNSEVEDMMPYSLLEKGISHLFIMVEDESFDEAYDETKPIVPQIEKFASENDIELPAGWKVDLAKAAKQRLLGKKVPSFDEKYREMWQKLFTSLTQ